MKAEARGARTARDRALKALDFDQSPFTIAWEVTRACAYACKHCRASARPRRDPRELSTEEAFALVDDLSNFGTDPILVLTGGDPLMRPDVFEIAAAAHERGLKVSLTPTATALVTKKKMEAAKQSGVRRVAFSVDAADPEVHDSFRGFSGSFKRTFDGIMNAKAAGLPIQINTTVTAINSAQLPQMLPLLEEVGAVQWSVFFLVKTGRGVTLEMVSADEHERILTWLFDLTESAPYDIKATVAPQYRRIALQRSGKSAVLAGAGYRYEDGLNRPPKGVNDGRGFMFISHIGDVYPSGFFPIKAGNVRERSAVDIYRNSSLFRKLRNPDLLRGKCGRCEYRQICGGSRARALATHGSYLASDPSCPYQPEVANGASRT